MACRLSVVICFTFAVIAADRLNAQALNAEENAIKQRFVEYYEHRSKGDATLPTFVHEDVDMRLSSTATTIQIGRAAVLQRLRQAVGQPPPRLQIQKITFLTDTLALVDGTLETDVKGGNHQLLVLCDGKTEWCVALSRYPLLSAAHTEVTSDSSVTRTIRVYSEALAVLTERLAQSD